MLLTKRTNAWDELVGFEEDGLLNDDAITLISVLCDEDMTDALDNVVAHEFPEGVDEDELCEFFNNEVKFICEEMGITKKYDKFKNG